MIYLEMFENRWTDASCKITQKVNSKKTNADCKLAVDALNPKP